MKQALTAMGIAVHGLAGDRDMDRLRLALRFADGVLDGILGTGFRGTLRPIVRQAVELVNAAGKPVLAIDIPSGVEADTGQSAMWRCAPRRPSRSACRSPAICSARVRSTRVSSPLTPSASRVNS